MDRISQLLHILPLLFAATLFTGCATSGYYNPPATGDAYSTHQQIGFEGEFNGQPVAVSESGQASGGGYYSSRNNPVRDQQDWYKLSQRQQQQNHREAMDRAKQAERERNARIDRVEDVVDIFGDVVKTVKGRRR